MLHGQRKKADTSSDRPGKLMKETVEKGGRHQLRTPDSKLFGEKAKKEDNVDTMIHKKGNKRKEKQNKKGDKRNRRETRRDKTDTVTNKKGDKTWTKGDKKEDKADTMTNKKEDRKGTRRETKRTQ